VPAVLDVGGRDGLQRAVIRDYAARMSLYRDERDALEAAFVQEAARQGTAAGAEARRAFTLSCFERAAEATSRWTAQVAAAPAVRRPSRLFALAWDLVDRQAARSP
jgi:hypothetical protein